MEASREQALISIEDLTKVFAIHRGFATTEFTAVDNARFALDAAKPEIFTLVGESGSGKTTLARMILGMVAPTAGHMFFKNRDVTKLSSDDKRKWFMKEVQPIFQDPFATFSPLNRIESYLYETAYNFHVVRGRQEADRYVDATLGEVGLSLAEVKNRYPNELSGGQLQRISVARALITNPSLLVADEPVSMLDASLRMSVVNLFKRLKETKGVSIVYITHDLATAYYSADRIAIMLRGVIVESGSVEHVLGNPLHPYTQILKQSVPEADPDKRWTEKRTLAGLETEEYLQKGCKFASRCPHVMPICRQQAPGDTLAEGRAVKCFLYESQAAAAGGAQPIG